MTWYEAGSLATLIDLTREEKEIAGHKVLFIWHLDKVHAIQSQCPHLKLPLLKGQITDNNEIICPFHKSRFDLCHGEVKCWSPWPKVVGPLLGKVSKPHSLTVYEVKLEDDKILVNI